MKSRRRSRKRGVRLPAAAALLGMGVMVSTLSAAETNAPPATEETNAPSAAAETNAPPAAKTDSTAASKAAEAPKPMKPEEFFEGGTTTFNNWIEVTAGGFLNSGNKSAFQQDRQSVVGPFGGISDFHYQQNLDKTTVLTADGRALFDQRDYRLNLGVTREKLGYLRLNYNQFRTWYDGDGGFYPPSGAWYAQPGDGLGLDRGEISLEAGLRMEKVPNITFKYSHNFREGEKNSTSWGYTHPAGGTLVRGLSPSLYDLDEKSDAFQLDVDHRLKKTTLGAGLRYEAGTLDNALKVTQFPGEPVEQRLTDRQNSDYDLFNAHAFSETWFKNNLMFSAGFAYSGLDNDFSGSRIYGATFNAPYAPDPQSGFGYFGLDGDSHLHEYVLNLNLMSKLSKHLTLTPSVRAEKRTLDANFNGTETLADFATTPFNGDSSRDYLELRERLDLSYTGVTNWAFNVRGEWAEGQGDLTENGGLVPVSGIGVPPVLRETDDSRFYQKYGAVVRWYPVRRVTANVGGYYKLSTYDYDHDVDSTSNNGVDRYPAYLVGQDLATYDGNAGLTLRPRQNVTLISRYEFQYSTARTRPDSISGLDEAESLKTTSHILSQNVGWSPWSRLNLQAGLNYVLSESESPVNDPAVPNSQNDYWIVTFFSGLVLDDKTDLNLNYFYYRADDYVDNALAGVPYGAGAEEHGVTATLVRRLTKSLRLNVRYGFYHFADEPSGGHRDYDAHFVSSSLQYRF